MTPLSLPQIRVLFSPAEFLQLHGQDLSRTTCVVFDVLRATSTLLEALHQGARGIWPAETIEDALALKQSNPHCLLAGEREGLRITAAQSGGVDFDLGNSPLEFTASVVADREIIMTTTNGTRALSACRGAAEILAASFSNIGAVAAYLTLNPPSQLLLICSGTLENASFEDALGAGALVDRLWPLYGDPVKARPDDSAAIVRSLFQHHQSNLLASARLARNGRRLLAVPQLAPDLPLCMDLDRLNLVARVDSDGILRVIDSQSEN